jgi:hypothetical protein
MVSEQSGKTNPISTNGVTDTLSPCLRLLIEILANEVTMHRSAVAAVNETDVEKDEGMPPIRHQSRGPS